MTTTGDLVRAWRGPTLLSYGFRPFFLLGSLWAALAMIAWIGMLTGRSPLPIAFDPVSWHAHEFLFGYLGAVMAGFMLTAVPNWTGHLPVVGWPLAGLVGLWLIGRTAILVSAWLPPALVAAADLALPVALAAALLREFLMGKSRKNLAMIGLLCLFLGANALFHLEVARGINPAQGVGLRLGLAAAILLIAVIGGRIVPSFTRNWLAGRRPGRLGAAPDQPFDRLALAVLAAAALVWVWYPAGAPAAGLLAGAGALHLVRLARWAGDRVLAEPLLWAMHLGYGFVPLGALALASSRIVPEQISPAAAQHLWMAGSIGLMTLAVMARTALSHTGREVRTGRATALLFAALIAAVLTRLAAGAWPGASQFWLMLSGGLWIAAFGGFAALYGPMLGQSRRPRSA